MIEFISESESATADFASEFAGGEVSAGAVIALRGSLGAGKTVFARGFAAGLGISCPVTSPTFTIVQEYAVPGGISGGLPVWLYHLDLYRVLDESAALAFGIEDFLDAPDAVKLIEWPERIEGLLPMDTIDITIEHIDERRRKITSTLVS
ncbi:MAG: tRNA (adenosine(37)-N6)-threonylcarbamoyltransferase complex ATPase subunit type 1 TsaE [Victivallales bacterium]|nr:tRNA (adenosine(37)-N6)-threonylcarbamoyltransferase complex ATPase subunit type 1 TsaE [Victivallales bacterium]